VAVDLWKRPGGAASTGFHLRHLAGALDRLFTYARGQQLDESQRQALRREDLPSDAEVDADELLREAIASIERALAELRQTKNETLLEPRAVGQRGLPSNVLGLLFHAAEHTTRHVGQLITTVKAVSGGEAGA
jgi:uncharacterized damage-inducible protein DinB